MLKGYNSRRPNRTALFTSRGRNRGHFLNKTKAGGKMEVTLRTSINTKNPIAESGSRSDSGHG